MPRHLRSESVSYGHRFHVRYHDITYPADLRVTPDFVHCATATFSTLTKCFQGNIQTDLVTVLEAIGYRLGKAVDLYLHSIYHVCFHTFAERRSGKSDKFYRQAGSGEMSFNVNSHPDLERRLCCQIMKTKCGKKADHAVGDCFANLGQSLMLCYLCISQSIETAPDALNHTPLAHAADLYPGNFILFKIAGTYHALPAE